MLSDEEKEALINFKSEYETCDHYSSDLIIELDDAEIILNLIEKQSNEIEEMKKQLDLDNECEIALNSKIMDLEKEIEELKREKAKRSWVHIKENGEVEPLFYISKDKIKAKIEEVEQWELYNMKIPRLSTLDERLGAKIGIKYVLQSLLEKE